MRIPISSSSPSGAQISTYIRVGVVVEVRLDIGIQIHLLQELLDELRSNFGLLLDLLHGQGGRLAHAWGARPHGFLGSEPQLPALLRLLDDLDLSLLLGDTEFLQGGLEGLFQR